MSGRQAIVALLVAMSSGAVAGLIGAKLVGTAPARLLRTNVRGRRVPVILGLPVAGTGLLGLLILAVAPLGKPDGIVSARMLLAAGLIIVVMAAAGLIDDLRGDEQPRGFKGHLGALRKGRLTGGMVKLLAGGSVGLLAGALIAGEGSLELFRRQLLDYGSAGWSDLWRVVEVGLFVALSANLINLLDRAPGRATKSVFVLGIPCLLWSSGSWIVAAAPLFGGLAGVFALDLRERGMAGDAGVNPVGGILGLGLATIPAPGRTIVLIVLLLLNLASEKWSFSRVIESRALLARFDRCGRLPDRADPSDLPRS